MPSVRGTGRRLGVGLVLAGTAALTGALAGFGAGVAWRAVGWPALAPWSVVAAVGVALALDGSPVAPWSVRRQVPQLWGRIFPPVTVAVLYGARLGVGPLTILRTWLWWAMFVVGASAGPWWSAGVGAVFGAVRVAAMVAVGVRAGGLRALERRWATGLGAGVVAVALVAAVAGAPAEPAGERAASSTPSTRPSGERDDPSAPSSSTTPTPATSAPVAPVPDQGLGGALPESVLPGFERVADDPARRLGPLDLRTAAAIEQDEPAERALLETRRFQRGQARAWRGPDEGQLAYASVYEFASPADASAYLTDGLTTIEARGARVYPVDAPAGGRGFSQAEQAASGEGSTVAHGVVVTVGARFALVFVSSRDSSLGPADAAAAAVAVASAVGG